MRITIILISLLSGCTLIGEIQMAWIKWDLPSAVTPVAESSKEERWVQEVGVAIEEWNQVMEGMGCEPPFWIDEGGYPIELLPEYTLGDNVGLTYRTNIQVEDVYYRHNVLLHELGHVMGLEHADGSVPSIMEVTPDEVGGIQRGDVVNAYWEYCR